MEKDETTQTQDIGRSRRFLLKLLGMGSLAGAGVVAITTNASASSGAAPAAAAMPTATAAPVPKSIRLHSYLAAKDVDAVVAFMRAAFGAVQTQRFTDESGQAIHATLSIGGNDMYVGKESPSMNFLAPATLGNFTAFVMVVVPNADNAFNQALAAGATMLQEPTVMPYGRVVACVADPFGQYWQINEVIAATATATGVTTQA